MRVGVTSLLEFRAPGAQRAAAVHVRYVDLSIELQVLGFYRSRQEAAGPRGPSGRRAGARGSARSA